MKDKLQAVNSYVIIIRDEAETEIGGGLILPDQARVKPATGEIISVGKFVADENIKIGRKAVFNKNTGFDIEIDGYTFTVLQGGNENSQIIATL